MSEAEKRRDWRTWEATRDEHALRRYVWALCREAPPTPPDTSALGSRYVRWLDADHNETSSAVGLPPAEDIHGLARTSLYEKPPRTVTAPVRRLTVCGPWLPKSIAGGWLRRAYGVSMPHSFSPGTDGTLTLRVGGQEVRYSSLPSSDGTPWGRWRPWIDPLEEARQVVRLHDAGLGLE